MHRVVLPMLASDATDFKNGTVTSPLINNSNYFAEKKYDGSRYILQWGEGGVPKLTSRTISVKTNEPVDKTANLMDYLYVTAPDLEGTVLDGEVILLKDGKEIPGAGSSEINKVMLSSPERCKELLAEYSQQGLEIAYAAYDILYYKSACVKEQTLYMRKASLEQALCDYDNSIRNTGIPFHRMILVIPTLGCPQSLIDSTLAEGWEGIMLKHKDSKYVEGTRSKDRNKIKRIASYDGVITGYKKGTGKYRHSIGALYVGQYFPLADGTMKLIDVCTISGMNDAQRNQYRKTLDAMLESGEAAEFNKGYKIHNPSTIVEFVAQEKTKKRYRHPRFIQERQDKNILDCTF